MPKSFLKIMQERASIRSFTKDKIKLDDLKYILECARLSPSSLGLEPWKFLVIQNEKEKEEISKIANNQNHVKDCAALIVVLARADFKEYFETKLRKRNLNEEELNKRIQTYKPFLENMTLEQSFAYAREQTHIALANILNAANDLDIQSCTIGGFDKDKINKYFKLNTDNFRVAIMVALGYTKDNLTKEKSRFDFDDVVEFRD